MKLKPEGGSNYIFIVDMGGLRIAHFGDIGQDRLTQEQLEALGEVDIALTQLLNPIYGQMDLENKKGFNLMAQVNPKLIICTHGRMRAIEYAMELWEVYATDAIAVTLSRSDLSEDTRMLVMGSGTSSLQRTYDLPEW